MIITVTTMYGFRKLIILLDKYRPANYKKN